MIRFKSILHHAAIFISILFSRYKIFPLKALTIRVSIISRNKIHDIKIRFPIFTSRHGTFTDTSTIENYFQYFNSNLDKAIFD